MALYVKGQLSPRKAFTRRCRFFHPEKLNPPQVRSWFCHSSPAFSLCRRSSSPVNTLKPRTFNYDAIYFELARCAPDGPLEAVYTEDASAVRVRVNVWWGQRVHFWVTRFSGLLNFYLSSDGMRSCYSGTRGSWLGDFTRQFFGERGWNFRVRWESKRNFALKLYFLLEIIYFCRWEDLRLSLRSREPRFTFEKLRWKGATRFK